MSDDTSAALERLKEIASRRDDGVAMYLWSEEARPILAHIADLEARAKEAEARAERAEAARLNVEGRWLAAESERRDAVQRAEWAEAFGHVFHALPDGRLDFVAVREGSPLGELHRRAGAAEAREAELRAALERLNAELDAFWNEPVEIKYPEGRMNVVYEQLITDAQMACRQALAAVPAAPEKPSGESGWLPADPPAEWIEAMADSVHDELCKLFDTYLLHDEEAADVARAAYAALARKMEGRDAE